MIKNYVIACIAILAIASCSPGGGKSEIKETSDGYKYQIISKGKGPKTVIGDYAYFNAEVTSLTGEIVFSSAETGQPGVMKLAEATPGNPSPFSEIFLNANVGDSIHVFLGKESAQGTDFDSLIYKVGLFDMVNEKAYQEKLLNEQAANQIKMEASKGIEAEIAAKVADIYKSIKNDAASLDIKTTASGLKYIIHEKGDGAALVEGKNVAVNYYGILSRTGEEFDNSWKRGQSFSFPLGKGRVIKGWDEGVALLNKGTKATLIIPGDLGYGAQGSGKIEPNDELIFYIEVDK